MQYKFRATTNIRLTTHSTRAHIQVLVLDLPSAHHTFRYWFLTFLQHITHSVIGNWAFSRSIQVWKRSVSRSVVQLWQPPLQQKIHSATAFSPLARDTFSYLLVLNLVYFQLFFALVDLNYIYF